MVTRSAAYSRYRHHNVALYRSGLEDKVATFLEAQGVQGNYECYEIEYTVPESRHKYTPDFVLPNGIIIETKGVWDAADRKKHLLIREQYPDLDIRFVFSRAKTPLYKGSRTSYGAFCEKHGIKYAEKNIPIEWLKEKPNRKPMTILQRKRKS